MHAGFGSVDATLWHYQIKEEDSDPEDPEDTAGAGLFHAEKQNTVLTITSEYPRYD
jgi:hypothetical protein